jgi:hypothetical protein
MIWNIKEGTYCSVNDNQSNFHEFGGEGLFPGAEDGYPWRRSGAVTPSRWTA